MASGIFLLLCAMWGGLLRIGWGQYWPDFLQNTIANHGALMIGGFFGTVISVERSVALGKAWTYGTPVFSALGALALVFGAPLWVGQLLILIGSIVLVVIFIWLVKRQHSLFMITMGLGAVSWAVGNALWMAGWPIPWLVSWWVGFLVLTIYGERLELSRFIAPKYGRYFFFSLAAFIYSAGVILSCWWLGLGWLISGIGFLFMAGWLVIHDLAMRTIRTHGLPRFAAACLLSGYFWIAASGVIIIGEVLIRPLLNGAGTSWISNAPLAGLPYDAMLHSILVGFVFAMIFGHAPIIFPAVLGVVMAYHWRFYIHLVLLEAAMVLRIVADLLVMQDLREWSGLLMALALLLFLFQTLTSIRGGGTPAAPVTPPRPARKPAGRSISLGAVGIGE